jgi:hypothetical protein
VSESVDRRHLLLGEARCSARPLGAAGLERVAREVVSRPAPELPSRSSRHQPVRALFVPQRTAAARDEAETGGVIVVTAEELIGSRPDAIRPRDHRETPTS